MLAPVRLLLQLDACHICTACWDHPNRTWNSTWWLKLEAQPVVHTVVRGNVCFSTILWIWSSVQCRPAAPKQLGYSWTILVTLTTTCATNLIEDYVFTRSHPLGMWRVINQNKLIHHKSQLERPNQANLLKVDMFPSHMWELWHEARVQRLYRPKQERVSRSLAFVRSMSDASDGQNLSDTCECERCAINPKWKLTYYISESCQQTHSYQWMMV